MDGCVNLVEVLPEDCVSRILSLTSPEDACRVLGVSREFRAPAESDIVWDKFLPQDYCQILASRTTIVVPFNFSSKKELFFLLSDSILIDAGYKTFGLEKSDGRKFYVLSARKVSIFHSEISGNWTWKSIADSRFPEVAELITVSRLQIQGTIRAQELSPNTKYGAYLLFKISKNSFGLDSIPCETAITSGDRVLTTNTAYLRDPDNKKQHVGSLFYGNRVEMMKGLVNKGGEMAVEKRGEGWLEVELGEFLVEGNGEQEIIGMRLTEVKGHQLKGGLIVEGIEVRPKNSLRR